MGDFSTGLWLQYSGAPEVQWEALDGIPVMNDSAMIYLHGVCGIFALALHDIFGYKLDWAVEDDIEWAEQNPDPMDYLVHVFCYDEEREAFIDVRGITTSMKDFFEEFEDFFTPPGVYVGDLEAEALRQSIIADKGEETFQNYYDLACIMINEHRDWYEMP